MFDSWLTLSGSGFDLKRTLRDLDPELSRSGHGWGRPARFATYRDPEGRFELGYPSGWELEVGEGVLVRSKHLAAFARVDLLATSQGIWEALQAAVARSGGSLTIRHAIGGGHPQLRAGLDLRGGSFEVHAWAYPRGPETLVLSTGRGAGPGRGAPWTLYTDQVLAAIRRAFRVTGSDLNG